MDAKQISKQILDFNKMAFEKSFSAMLIMQDQAEKAFNMGLEQNTWFPEEGKKAIEKLVNTYKESREDFKCKVEDGYEKAAGYLS